MVLFHRVINEYKELTRDVCSRLQAISSSMDTNGWRASRPHFSNHIFFKCCMVAFKEWCLFLRWAIAIDLRLWYTNCLCRINYNLLGYYESFFVSDHDGAEPCGNSVAVQNLLRLSVYLDRPDLRTKAGRTLTFFSDKLCAVPVALAEMSSALMFYQDSPTQVMQLSITYIARSACNSRAGVYCCWEYLRVQNILLLLAANFVYLC